MSSSGKGQSLLKSNDDVQKAWDYAQEGGRAGKGRVIVEGFIDFDYEITLLTVRHIGGTTFCAPVGHRQEKGDYQESWQPQAMSPAALVESERVAKAVTEALGGRGMFGVELFIKGDQVWFSEVSPRPHDTGLVTLISQDLSQFALHARAILGLPIPLIRQFGPSASAVILVEASLNRPRLPISALHWPSLTPHCACSASRKSTASAAWALRWPATNPSTLRGPRRLGHRRPSTSNCRLE